MERGKEKAVAAVYVLGTVMTGILLLIYVMRCDVVLFPEAMLPMRLYEQASVWLAWGAVPMGIASALLYRQIPAAEGGRKNWKALGVFIPAATCTCFFVYWIAVWVLGMFGIFFKL